MVSRAYLVFACFLIGAILVACGPSADPPVASGRIVFQSGRDGSQGIYVMNADGSGVTHLTDLALWPSLSPDGKRVLFTSQGRGQFDIYAMNADGSEVTRLTEGRGWDYHPAWSPDGKHIAFASSGASTFPGRCHSGDLDCDIYVMDADGSGQTNLTNNPATDWGPVWSPGGKQIIFMSERDGNLDIFSVYADGSGQINLTNHQGEDMYPSWSPDGKRIAFVSNRDDLFPTNCPPRCNFDIYVMEADGSGQINLTDNPAYYAAAWSPDGKRIAFVSSRDDPFPSACAADCNMDIYVMEADGSGQTNLTNNPAGDMGLTWSPDGKRIAFVSDRDGNQEIYVINVDGSGLTNLTNDPAEDSAPSWSSE